MLPRKDFERGDIVIFYRHLTAKEMEECYTISEDEINNIPKFIVCTVINNRSKDAVSHYRNLHVKPNDKNDYAEYEYINRYYWPDDMFAKCSITKD